MDFKQWLAANGYDADALNKPESAKQLTHLQAAWKAETQPSVVAAVAPTETVDDKLSAWEAENERVSTIKTMCEKWASENAHGDQEKFKQLRQLQQAAIDDKKTDIRGFQLQMLRFDRSVGMMITTPKGQEATGEVVEAALCMAGRLGTTEKDFSEQTLEAAHKRFKSGIGLHEIIGMSARQNGWRGDSVKRDLRGALRAAFSGNEMQANVGPSTLSISGILSNTANKFIREGFEGVEAAWRSITSIRSVSDFKTITSYSLTGDLSYEKLAPGGEIKHGTLGNETYTNQADTYAKFLGIDRRDLINDDLGALTRVRTRLGRGGALKLNEVFWTEFLADHSTFFPTDASLLNYDAGTDTAFTADGLTAAEVFWDAKTDPDGKPLALMAKYLLVPPGYKNSARRLMGSPNTLKDSDLGNNNPHAGKYEVVSSVYLSNSAMGGGYSALAWYLIADPQDLPVIETCFLNGNESPVIEDVELDSDRLGMAMRGYFDFGVNKQEYRAALKLKGEN